MQHFLNTKFSDMKTLHFIGIGGIGMSGIASLFCNIGFNVQGSDLKESSTTGYLRSLGMKIFIGHSELNIQDADIIVVSSAIKNDNVELVSAIGLGIPIVQRSRMLAELMRFKWGIAVAGTHGKTTTASLIYHIMHSSELDPTAVIGGVVNSLKSNNISGSSNWLIAESDESDGSFLDLSPIISIVTNIDDDHIDYYGTYDNIKQHFKRFIHNLPFYGFAVLCLDDKGVQDILPSIRDTSIITYGFSSNADVRVVNLKHTKGGVVFDLIYQKDGQTVGYNDLFISVYGKHNALNALGAITVTLKLGVSIERIVSCLSQFQGIRRRFTKIGEHSNTLFIDDYAHHPREIKAVIETTRELKSVNGKSLVIVQPHRYSRLQNHFEEFYKCFVSADYVWVLDVYSAGETPILNYSAQALTKAIKEYGHNNATYVDDQSKLVDMILALFRNDEIGTVLFLGAGDISNIAYQVFDEYKIRDGNL